MTLSHILDLKSRILTWSHIFWSEVTYFLLSDPIWSYLRWENCENKKFIAHIRNWRNDRRRKKLILRPLRCTRSKIMQNINLSNFTPKESGPFPIGLRSIPSPTWMYRSSESAKWNRSPKGRFGQNPPRLSRCNNKATTTTKQEVSRRI